MATIESNELWDLRELGELATECFDELEDEDTDEDDKQDARETLEKLAELCGDLGHAVDATDGEAVASKLEELGNGWFGPLISEDHFTAYAQQLVEDIGDIPNGLPAYLANNIDWEGVASDLKVDYTSITFDGEDWYIR